MQPASSNDILIIGGGASGMMAAIAAARHGAAVCILERMDRVGKKLLVTGNSRCNLTNLNMTSAHYHGASDRFISTGLYAFSQKDTLHFFEKIGLSWYADDEKRVFPSSNQASSVLDLLRFAMERHHIQIKCSALVEKLAVVNGFFAATLKNRRVFSAKRLILAAGGQAFKDLGSNGSGFLLAKSLGHDILDPFPALVRLHINNRHFRSLKGLRIQAGLHLLVNNERLLFRDGEILFTEDGLSGIPALSLSRRINELMRSEKPCMIGIDLFPHAPIDKFKPFLLDRFQTLPPVMTLEESLVTLIHKRLIGPLLKILDLPPQRRLSSLTSQEIARMAQLMKLWKMPVIGTKAWNEAQITAGGVNTSEIDPETMQSNLIDGLYFAGEVMDVDGDTGGYNLQWAWSSGYLAGKNAGESLNKRGDSAS